MTGGLGKGSQDDSQACGLNSKHLGLGVPTQSFLSLGLAPQLCIDLFNLS